MNSIFELSLDDLLSGFLLVFSNSRRSSFSLYLSETHLLTTDLSYLLVFISSSILFEAYDMN
jgi:hypothetical protein